MSKAQGKLVAKLQAPGPLDTFDRLVTWLRGLEGDPLMALGVSDVGTEMRVRVNGDGAVIGVAFYEEEEATDGG